MDTPTHVPVLLDRCIGLLAPALESVENPIVVDATLGLGGHSEALLTRFPRIRLVGLDRDLRALALSAERLAPFKDRIHLVHAIYDELPQVLSEAGIEGVHGILFDLGVSSMQLDDTSRGFSYSQDAPLDMRMDASQGLNAAEVVNTYSVGDLARVIATYGEERFARRIAQAIVRERGQAPIDRTARLAELVRSSIPAATRRTGGHPAKRTFQALRIEVNGELHALERAIPAALDALRVHGRIVVMSYQSLEDRIVKQALTARATSTSPQDLPVELPGHGPTLKLLTRGAEEASPEEALLNPRATSVKLRAAERVAA
jgi:16S rRNA (cytosine1402-N4)-methyltransferase